MVQCKKYSESTAGNGTQRKTVIFTADIFTVHLELLEAIDKLNSPEFIQNLQFYFILTKRYIFSIFITIIESLHNTALCNCVAKTSEK